LILPSRKKKHKGLIAETASGELDRVGSKAQRPGGREKNPNFAECELENWRGRMK